MQGCDTLATRRQRALHGAKPPPPPVSSALQGPRVRIGRRWVAEARQLHTRKVPRRNKSRPTRTTPRRFGTKLSQHEPHGPTSGTKLSLFTRNGSIWRFFYMQGEFCTVVTAKKLRRENFVPNGRVGARQQDTRPHLRGGCRRDRCGGHGRVSRHSLAAVPVDNGARPRCPWTAAAPSPSKFRMQFPHDTDPCTLKNRRISTIRLQHLKYTQGNCMRNCRNPVRTQHHATTRPHWCGGYGRASRHSLAAVPVGGGGARPQCQWITGPGRSIHKQQQHPAQANFACNSPTTRIHARSKTAEYQRSDFNT